jgi:nucleoside-diphosphate-sugar epimerase
MDAPLSAPPDRDADAVRVLITGASSMVGDHLLAELATDAARPVLALGRRRPAPANVPWQPFDLAQRQPLPIATAWIHLAPLPLAVPHLDAAAAAGVRRLVAVGTTSRHVKHLSRRAAERRATVAQRDAEAALAARCPGLGIRWTVLRPPLVYCEGRDGNVTTLARLIRRAPLLPVAGRAEGLRQPLHAADLAWACGAVLDNPRTYGRIYDLPGGETLTYRTLLERIAVALGRRVRLIGLPAEVLDLALWTLALHPRFRHVNAEMGRRMNQDLVYDGGDAQRDFGFRPRPFSPVFPDGFR